jgi:hypothetical protein
MKFHCCDIWSFHGSIPPEHYLQPRKTWIESSTIDSANLFDLDEIQYSWLVLKLSHKLDFESHQSSILRCDSSVNILTDYRLKFNS